MRFGEPVDRYYDGLIYARLIDPMLRGCRKMIAGMIPEGSRVADFGCGTGALCRDLAQKGCHVTGYDFSSAMIRAAHRLSRNTTGHIAFRQADVLVLDPATFGELDCIVLSLVLHEQDMPIRMNTLQLAANSAHHVIIADFNYPIPGRLGRWITYSTEFLAGPKHFKYFRMYNLHEGMQGLLDDFHLRILDDHTACNGIVRIVRTCSPVTDFENSPEESTR